MGQTLVKKYRENENFRLAVNVMLIWICSRVFFLLAAAIFNAVNGTNSTFTELVNQWDCKRYNYIVEHGYTFPNDEDPQANWAFFPMYPLVCMAVKAVTFGMADTYHVGMFVSNACVIIASFFSLKLVNYEADCETAESSSAGFEGSRKARRDAWFPSLFMLAGPYSFYMAGMMTEAMFAMFIVLFFYCCKKKKYMLAGIMAACASATRIVGCILVFSLIIEMYQDICPGRISVSGIKKYIVEVLKTPKKMLSILVCPLGIFVYMTFLYFFCGDAWAFKSVQIAWRDENYFPIVGVLWKACTGQMEPRYTYMGWMCIFFIGTYIYMICKKRYSMGVFGLITLLIPLTSHVMSTCRFTLGTYVFLVGASDMLHHFGQKSKWVKPAAYSLLFIGSVVLLCMWYMSSSWLL